jgi:hypothetical protein
VVQACYLHFIDGKITGERSFIGYSKHLGSEWQREDLMQRLQSKPPQKQSQRKSRKGWIQSLHARKQLVIGILSARVGKVSTAF